MWPSVLWTRLRWCCRALVFPVVFLFSQSSHAYGLDTRLRLQTHVKSHRTWCSCTWTWNSVCFPTNWLLEFWCFLKSGHPWAEVGLSYPWRMTMTGVQLAKTLLKWWDEERTSHHILLSPTACILLLLKEWPAMDWTWTELLIEEVSLNIAELAKTLLKWWDQQKTRTVTFCCCCPLPFCGGVWVSSREAITRLSACHCRWNSCCVINSVFLMLLVAPDIV